MAKVNANKWKKRGGGGKGVIEAVITTLQGKKRTDMRIFHSFDHEQEKKVKRQLLPHKKWKDGEEKKTDLAGSSIFGLSDKNGKRGKVIGVPILIISRVLETMKKGESCPAGKR